MRRRKREKKPDILNPCKEGRHPGKKRVVLTDEEGNDVVLRYCTRCGRRI